MNNAKMAQRRLGRSTKVRESTVDRFFLVGVYILLTTFLLIVLVPLWFIVVCSFSSPAAVSAGEVFLWPVDFTLRGYEVALSSPQILKGFGNSLYYTVVGTAISVALTVMIAYPLSRVDFVGRKVLTGAVVFTMLFAGGLIPTYLVVQSLGMLDTRWAMLIPNAVAVWPTILILNNDAGGDATSALERQQLSNLLKYSLIVVSTVPMMLIYPFVARYFTKGLLLGAVKG